jgi:hypothetical protein
MEIVEIIGFHLNNFEEVLEITFRTNDDTEDLMRESKIPFIEIEDFGYEFHNINDEDLELNEEDDYFDNDLFVDENEILSFLNEYYLVFIDKLPNAELI